MKTIEFRLSWRRSRQYPDLDGYHTAYLAQTMPGPNGTNRESNDIGSDAVWSDLADLVPDLMCECTRDHITVINRAGAALLGADDPARLVHMPFARLLHPDYDGVTRLGLSALATEPDDVPVLLRGLDGRARAVHMRVRLLGAGDPSRVLVFARDVSPAIRRVGGSIIDRQDHHQRFRHLVDEAMSFVCLIRDGRLTYVNRQGLRLLGAGKPDQLVGRAFTEIFHPDYRPVLEGGPQILVEERDLLPVKLWALDGRAVEVEARVARVPGDEPGVFVMEAHDMSSRQKALTALQDREVRLKGIVESVSDAIITTNDHGIILSLNHAAETMLGYPRAEVMGRSVNLMMPAHVAARHDGYYQCMRVDAGQRVLGMPRVLEVVRKDGSRFPAEIVLTRLRLAEGVVITAVMRDVTERVRREDAEHRYKEELQRQVEDRTREVRRLARQTELILQSAGDGILGVNVDGMVTFGNPVAERLLQAAPGGLAGRPLVDVFRLTDTCWPPLDLLRVIEGRASDAADEILLRTESGASFAVEYAVAPIVDEGHRIGAVVVFRDVSVRKEAEARLRLAFTVIDTAAQAVVVCNAEHRIEMVNPAFALITGYSAGDVLGRPVGACLFKSPDRYTRMVAAMEREGTWAEEFWDTRRDGYEMAVRVVASTVPQGMGVPPRWVFAISDITQRKRDDERIRFQANHDALTRLPNRANFMEVLAQAVAEASRQSSGLALMFVDLDGFKAINDTMGHDAGDLLLKGAAQRLRHGARERDIVARLGGDEFTVLLPGIDNREDAARVADRLVEALGKPFALNGSLGVVSASVGIAIMPGDGCDAGTLLRNADSAMYEAKTEGKARYCFYGDIADLMGAGHSRGLSGKGPSRPIGAGA